MKTYNENRDFRGQMSMQYLVVVKRYTENTHVVQVDLVTWSGVLLHGLTKILYIKSQKTHELLQAR